MGFDGSEYTAGYMFSGQMPTFKIYDSSESVIYDAYPSESFGWFNGQLYIIESLQNGPEQIDYCLDLHSGANLISFYALPEDASIDNMMSSLTGNVTGVLGQGVAANYVEEFGWVGSLNTISPTSGYWVIVNESDSLCIEGAVPTEPDIEFNLQAGANLVSFPSEGSIPIGDALPDDIENFISGIIGQGIAASNHPAFGWSGSLSEFEGGKGYWMITYDDVSFSYDLSMLSRIRNAPLQKLNGYSYKQSTTQAFYFIEDIENIEVGDWILAYNGDKVVGARQWQGSIIDVPAMGNDGSDYTKAYIEAGEVPNFKILRDGELINLEGDVPAFENNQLYMVSSLTEAVALPETFSLDRAYPNPFNPTTTLSFAIPVDAAVSLSIYNMQGREVSTLIDKNMDVGYHSVVWNADSYSSGVYFVKMVAGEYVNTQKLMLIK